MYYKLNDLVKTPQETLLLTANEIRSFNPKFHTKGEVQKVKGHLEILKKHLETLPIDENEKQRLLLAISEL